MTDIIEKRSGEDFGGGANNPVNYNLHCAECKKLLGPLGVFHERALTPDTAKKLAEVGVTAAPGSVVRIAHCTTPECHATTVVQGTATTCMPGMALGDQCALCARPWKKPAGALS